ncbi:BrnT family toxin [uncultured Methylobacterium sp.]|uniref:BrnT family toxin n=1 Tax=uncultured Methylobacterium sp. TaxID=157278 RepID=UPI0035CB59E4
MAFAWDEAKHERNLRERGFGFDFAALIFEGDTIEVEDDRMAYGKTRMRAIGRTSGFILTVVYTDRKDVRRIISARLSNTKERRR